MVVKKRPFYFPFGSIWSNLVHSNNSNSQTIEAIRTFSKKEAILVLDAHRSRVDIFASAMVVFNNIKFRKILMPVACSGYYLPIIHRGYESLNKLSNFEFHPVFRREDQCRFFSKLSWKIFGRGLSSANIKSKNRSYVERSLVVAQSKGHLIVVAPFGDTSSYGIELRKGVELLMRSGCPVICARAKFSWKDMRFEVFLSDILRFNENDAEADMRKKVLEVYADLDRAHRTRELSLLWSIRESKRRRDLAVYRGLHYMFDVTQKIILLIR